jgi:hypothetical protein
MLFAMRTRKRCTGMFSDRLWAVCNNTQWSLCSILRQDQTQIRKAREKPKMSLIARILLFLPGEWFVMHKINCLIWSKNFFILFPN